MRRLIRALSCLALVAPGCGDADDTESENDNDPTAASVTSAGVTTLDPDDPTGSTSMDPTGGSTSTGGPDTETETGTETEGDDPTDAAFYAVIQGPVMAGDSFGAVYLLANSFTPTPLLADAGTVFPSPTERVFAHIRDGNVYVFDIDAGTETMVSQGGTVTENDVAIEWAPTGEALMYRVNTGGSDQEVYVVRPDGSDHVQLAEFGVPFRFSWSEGNLAAAYNRDVAGGAFAQLTVVDMSMATPVPVEVDAFSGVDETGNREIKPCGDGVLAEIRTVPDGEVFEVAADGTATAITTDGMGGTPIGCDPDTGAVLFSRNLDIMGLIPAWSPNPLPLTGVEGYTGDGAFLFDGFLFYQSQDQSAWTRHMTTPEQGVNVVDEPLDFEEAPTIRLKFGSRFGLVAGDFMQRRLYVGGLGEGPAMQAFESQVGEIARNIIIARNNEQVSPEVADTALVFLSIAASQAQVKVVRGNGDLENGDGVVLGDATEQPYGCVAAGAAVLCLTERDTSVALSVLDRFNDDNGNATDVRVRTEDISTNTNAGFELTTFLASF